MQFASLFFHSGHPSVRERGRWAKNLPIPCWGTVGKLRRGTLFVQSFAIVGPHCLLQFKGRCEHEELKKCSISVLPWGNYKKLLRPRPNLNGAWHSNRQGWLRILRTSIQGGSASGGQMVQNSWTDGHYLQGVLLTAESGWFSEAHSLVTLCLSQVQCGSCTCSEWNAHHHHAAKGDHPHRYYSRTWGYHCPGIHEQPSA